MIVRWRHRLFVGLLLGSVTLTLLLLGNVLAMDGLTLGEGFVLLLYGVLLTWVGIGFWFAVFGLWAGRRQGTTVRPLVRARKEGGAARTVIVMPIYHEDAETVFDRLRVMYRSLERAEALESFEFFVLSDSQDPAFWFTEERAWVEACRDLGALGRLFYRRRTYNEGRKSGNVEDFCRTWGGRYDYMVVLDADSLLLGETLAEMLRRMDAEPGLGLLQTQPRLIKGDSLFARLQQFAGSAYGGLLARGLSYLTMSAATYWGHNAIIRMRAFVQHCALPKLPGKAPLGGAILSHDFVEAALLVRAGWGVRFDPDLSGSYEEGPPSLIHHAARDRRWCQGNLQHSRLLFAKGLHPFSRINFLIGIMSYLASPLWLLFIALSAIALGKTSGFTLWPSETASRISMLAALAITAVFLFGPKLLSLVQLWADPKRRREHGGAVRAGLSVLMETLFSALIAPLMMLLHSRFVGSVLAGFNSGWGAQRREADSTTWRDGIRAHGLETLIGLGAGIVVYFQVPQLVWWLSPLLAGLLLSVPLSVLSSRPSWGKAARSLGLFLTAEERAPPVELKEIDCYALERSARPSAERTGPKLLNVLADPLTMAAHLALSPMSKTRPAAHMMARVRDGDPESLTIEERRTLLGNAETARELHLRLFAERYRGG